MVYKKPKSTVKKGKGPSRSQQRASLADRVIKAKIGTTKIVTKQMQKDLTRRTKDEIRKNPKKVREFLTKYYKEG